MYALRWYLARWKCSRNTRMVSPSCLQIGLSSSQSPLLSSLDLLCWHSAGIIAPTITSRQWSSEDKNCIFIIFIALSIWHFVGVQHLFVDLASFRGERRAGSFELLSRRLDDLDFQGTQGLLPLWPHPCSTWDIFSYDFEFLSTWRSHETSAGKGILGAAREGMGSSERLISVSKAASSIALCFVTFSRCHFPRLSQQKHPASLKIPFALLYHPGVCWLQSFVYKYYGNPRSSGKSEIACQQIKHKAGTIKALWAPSLTDRVLQTSVLCSWTNITPWFPGHFSPPEDSYLGPKERFLNSFFWPVTALLFNSRASRRGFSASFLMLQF